jgi:hypothetical protein
MRTCATPIAVVMAMAVSRANPTCMHAPASTRWVQVKQLKQEAAPFSRPTFTPSVAIPVDF